MKTKATAIRLSKSIWGKMDRYQKFGLYVALVIGLLIFMWVFATSMTPEKIEESRIIHTAPKKVETIHIETH